MYIRTSFTLILTIFLLTSFTGEKDSYTVSSIRSSYINNLKSFQESVQFFRHELKQQPSRQRILELNNDIRQAFKRPAYILNHFDFPIVKNSFNGAPLPVPRQEGNAYVALEPQGLQVIDEMVYEETVDYEAIDVLLELMENELEGVIPFEQTRFISERDILEAMRQQLIRIATLQITGYDSPGSLSGVAESKTVLLQMLEDMKRFSPLLTEHTTVVFQEIIQLYKAAIAFIEVDDSFDEFDRTIFIRDYLNLVSYQLLVFQDLLNIGFRHVEIQQEKSWNDESPHLFSENLLNPYSYIGLTEGNEEHIVTLGAYLFYEPRLSHSQEMSCATCHQADKAFTDGKKLSISNHLSTANLRNTPTVINSAYSKEYFYDLRAHKMRDQVIAVIENEAEFNSNADSLAMLLLESPGYESMIKKAFPNQKTAFNRNQISAAISVYVMSLSSFSSPFDQYMRMDIDDIETDVTEGFNLFMGKAACGTCHFAPTFSGLVPPDFDENETEVLGVPNTTGDAIDSDIGRYGSDRKRDLLEHFKHSFKTTTVRNIELTAPYMHNGVFDTLDEVLDFYNNGGGEGQGLDVKFQTLAADSLHLSKTEMGQLISFMHSLTDTSFQYFVPDTLPRFMANGRLETQVRELHLYE
jgi:cytochrome c peroxidase